MVLSPLDCRCGITGCKSFVKVHSVLQRPNGRYVNSAVTEKMEVVVVFLSCGHLKIHILQIQGTHPIPWLEEVLAPSILK